MYNKSYKRLIDAQERFYEATKIRQLDELKDLLTLFGEGELDGDDTLDMLLRNAFSLYKSRYVSFPGCSEVDAYIERVLDPSERA